MEPLALRFRFLTLAYFNFFKRKRFSRTNINKVGMRRFKRDWRLLDFI